MKNLQLSRPAPIPVLDTPSAWPRRGHSLRRNIMTLKSNMTSQTHKGPSRCQLPHVLGSRQGFRHFVNVIVTTVRSNFNFPINHCFSLFPILNVKAKFGSFLFITFVLNEKKSWIYFTLDFAAIQIRVITVYLPQDLSTCLPLSDQGTNRMFYLDFSKS